MNASTVEGTYLTKLVGSGKSVLSAAVVDDLLLQQRQPGSLINFFFCEHDHAVSLMARTILGCLMRQCISRDNIPETVQQGLQTVLENDTVDEDELTTFFVQQSDIARTHYILIDGLDECAESERDKILDAFRALLGLKKPRIKLFLSGRDAIFNAFGQASSDGYHQTMNCNDVLAEIEIAIDALIREKKQQHKLVLQDPDLEQEIRIALKLGAGGM